MIFFDSPWRPNCPAAARWIKLLSMRTSLKNNSSNSNSSISSNSKGLTVTSLVCASTAEDNIGDCAMQDRIAADLRSGSGGGVSPVTPTTVGGAVQNGAVWRVKRQTLEELLGTGRVEELKDEVSFGEKKSHS